MYPAVILGLMIRRWACVLALLLFVGGAGAQEPEAEPAFRIGGEVKGQVGALVSLWDAQEPGRFLVKGETDARGRFRLGVPIETAERREHPFGGVIVVVQAKGKAQRRVEARAGTVDLKIKLWQVERIEGLVKDADGKPLPAIVVIGTSRGVREKTTTDENGRYVLEQFSSGPAIEVIGEGFRYRTAALDVIMPKVVMVAARILDPDGKPVVGARIRDGVRDAAVTDAEGRYRVPVPSDRIPGVRLARYRVHAPGFETARVDPVAGDTRLRPVEPLRGRVVDGDANVVREARIAIGYVQELVVWTDQHGHFSFDAMPHGMVDLRASARGYLPVAVRIEAGIAADRVTLRLLKGQQIEGRVVQDRKPVMGATVAALVGERDVAIAFTDARGRFQMAGVPNEATHLRASITGSRSQRAVIKQDVE